MYENFNPELLYFVHKQCPPTWSLSKDLLAFHDLTFVLGGSAVYYINDIPYALKAGDAIYIPRGNYRYATTDPSNPMLCVAFNFNFSGSDELKLDRKLCWNNDDTLKMYFTELGHEWLQQNPEFMLKSKALFMLVLHRIITQKTRSALGIQSKRIEKYILNNYADKLCVKKIASELSISPVYCGALFKQQTGVTINQFINQIRINKAAALLSSGDLTLSQAAYQSGFDDLFYFSKTFKSIMGIPPSAYRNMKT